MNNSIIHVFIISHLLHVAALSPSSGNLHQNFCNLLEDGDIATSCRTK